jgi:hypothetical protein
VLVILGGDDDQCRPGNFLRGGPHALADIDDARRLMFARDFQITPAYAQRWRERTSGDDRSRSVTVGGKRNRSLIHSLIITI